MKPLFDFLPLIAFFVAYKMYDIYVATGVLIVASIIQVIGTKLIWKKVEKMHLITLAILIPLGGLTIFFHNDLFIKWKVTVIYSAMALAIIVGQILFKTPLLKALLGNELQLPTQVSFRLGYAWAIFFLLCGLINVYVAFNLSQESWVNFKVFGLTGLTLFFALLQGLYIWKHLPKEETNPLEQTKD